MEAQSASVTARRQVYVLLIVVALAGLLGRIAAADAAVQSANDRSRWATVRALVDHGTYAVGAREADPTSGGYADRGIVTELGWQTVDKVLRPDTGEFYSSKPPLLPTLAAGVYWAVKQAFGWEITGRTWRAQRAVLVALNALPIACYMALLAVLAERFGATDWGRVYVVAAGCYATFVTTFGVVFNNHTVAACGVLAGLAAAVRATGGRAWLPALWYATAGFSAGFAAGVELPAAAFAVLLGVALGARSVRATVFGYVPAAAVPLVAAVATNYLAIGQLRPAYAEFGGSWYVYDGSYWQAGGGEGMDVAGRYEDKLTYFTHLTTGHHGLFSLTPVFLLAAAAWVWGGAFDRAAVVHGPIGVRATSAVAAVLTAVVVAFYVWRTDNYGGRACGPRWFLWLTPLLLLAATPAADALAASRAGRRVGLVLFAVSAFSAAYPVRTPWSHPWLYDLMALAGWVEY